MDLLFIGAIVALAALTVLLIGLCERLQQARKEQR
jgi:hypothetical protein